MYQHPGRARGLRAATAPGAPGPSHAAPGGAAATGRAAKVGAGGGTGAVAATRYPLVPRFHNDEHRP